MSILSKRGYAGYEGPYWFMGQVRWTMDFDRFPFKLPKRGRYIVYVLDPARSKRGREFWLTYPGSGMAYDDKGANIAMRKLYKMTGDLWAQYVERVADWYPVTRL